MGEMLDRLRPHVVNLTQGRLSTSGAATTTAQDVDAIFTRHLPAFVAAAGGNRVPVVVWAHGGLVDEASGLAIADRQVRWWLENGVYPIHFAWESGIGDAVRQIFASWLGSRGFWDDVRDRAAEVAARGFGGVKIWSAMKRSAELSSATGGGARQVANRLGEFVTAHPGAIDLHAVGHSAGAVFHSHFLPVAIKRGVPVASLSLLAPAIRVDDFQRTLVPRLGDGIDALTLFTMRRELEEQDECALGPLTFYHRSLLHLIRAALEDVVGTPILGLAECVADTPALRELFDGAHRAEAIWSRTDDASAPTRRSTSTTHGGFDGDAATMDSLARRFTGRDDIHGFTPDPVSRGPDLWAGPDGPTAASPIPFDAIPFGTAAPAAVLSDGGRSPRRALCVGIDAYPPPQTLSGCVADARAWASVLQGRGFHVQTLLDAEATRQNVLGRLVDLVRTSRAGDVVVFQYSGHGTSVTDTDGDEPHDEALCPVDNASGALILDDDLADVFAELPDGVNLTCVLDCCHSGSGTRAAFREPRPAGSGTVRFLTPTRELESAHRAFRARTAPRSAGPRRRAAVMREVTFSACRDTELAWETDGHGDFTRVATALLAGGALTDRQATADNQGFADRVLAGFGANPRQHPELDAAAARRIDPFLEPLPAPLPVAGVRAPAAAAPSDLPTAAAALLRAAADLIDAVRPT